MTSSVNTKLSTAQQLDLFSHVTSRWVVPYHLQQPPTSSDPAWCHVTHHDNAGVWCQVACGPDPSAACGKLVWIESNHCGFVGGSASEPLSNILETLHPPYIRHVGFDSDRTICTNSLDLLQSALCEQLTLATRALCANNLVLYVNIYEFWCTWSRITSGWQNINLAVMQYSVHICCWCCSQGL